MCDDELAVDFDEINLQTTDVELRTASVEVKQNFKKKYLESFKMLSHINQICMKLIFVWNFMLKIRYKSTG
jgi:hypothetical protein